MGKKDLTEQEIRSQYIRPAIAEAGWKPAAIREEYHFTAGRMHVTGQKAVRGKSKFVDYLLVHKNVPLAVVEAKDNKHSIGAGMQQGLAYAADLLAQLEEKLSPESISAAREWGKDKQFEEVARYYLSTETIGESSSMSG